MLVKNTSRGIRVVPIKAAKGQAQELAEILPGRTAKIDLDTKHPVVAGWIESGDLTIVGTEGQSTEEQQAALAKAQAALNAANEAHVAAEQELATAPEGAAKKKAAAGLKNAEEALEAAKAALVSIE